MKSGSTHLINIAGLACPPKTEKALNKWYDEWHIPVNWRFAGLEQVARYHLLDSSPGASAGQYPDYINVYWLKDFATFKAWNASPEMVESRKRRDELNQGGVEILWRVQYQSIKTWGETPPLSVIRVAGVQCTPESEASLDKWFNEKYVTAFLGADGLSGATRYRLAGAGDHGVKMPSQIKVADYPKFMTFYYFKDTASAQSFSNDPHVEAARRDWLEIAKQTGASCMWLASYEPIRAWQR